MQLRAILVTNGRRNPYSAVRNEPNRDKGIPAQRCEDELFSEFPLARRIHANATSAEVGANNRGAAVESHLLNKSPS